MNIELHLLQNFAPANLNRDDTGSPKDCEFGGYRRARISSQAQKRAMRTFFASEDLIPVQHRGVRTARLVEAIAQRHEANGRDPELARGVAVATIRALGIKMNAKRPEETSYLVFGGPDEIVALAQLGDQYWDALAAGIVETAGKKKGEFELPKGLANDARKAIDGHAAADVALFGRMLADLADRNRDAASQVAHAISVNKVAMEFDFFTAVDDLKNANDEEVDAGAGMLGTIEFNSSCFYRYFNLNLDQLLTNLAGDRELARSVTEAFLRAAIGALPTGKQNSFAAHQRPSLILMVVRNSGFLSLANAFLRPIAPRGDLDLMANAVAALDQFWQRMTTMYGADGVTQRRITVDPAYAEQLSALAGDRVDRAATAIEQAVGAAFAS